MEWTAIVGVCLVMIIASWYVMQGLSSTYKTYRQAFEKGAATHLSQFFLFIEPAQLWQANILFCLLLTAGGYLSGGSELLALIMGLAGLAMPPFLIRRLRKARLTRFDKQLPDLLLALAGALKAGSSTQVALRYIAQQSLPPISQEFALMFREQRMGVPFEQALAGLLKRIPGEGTALFVSTMKIANLNGGNLAETLERVAHTLRARLYFQGRVHALTSQGRMQAWVMACLPFALLMVLQALDPESMSTLWSTPVGWSVIGIIVVLELIGILFIQRIVNIDV